MSLHISGVCYESIADALGCATTIFFSGCKHYCEGCHSENTWDFNYGTEVTDELINTIRDEIKKRPFVKTIVLSGGDPFYSANEVNAFLDKLDLPDYSIWAYTGFTLEDFFTDTADEDMIMLLARCDYIVDGPFILDKRDITLNFRGSSNQRIFKKEMIDDKILWHNATDEI